MVTKYPIMTLLLCQKMFQFKLIYSILGHYAAVLAGMILQLFFGFFKVYFIAEKRKKIDSKDTVVNKKAWDVHAFKKAFIAVWHLNLIYFVILWSSQLYPTIDIYFEKNTANSCFDSCVLVFPRLDFEYNEFSL